MSLPSSVAQAQSVYGSASIITNRACTEAPGLVCTNATAPNFRQFAGGMSTGLTTSASGAAGFSGAADVSFGADYLPTVKAGSSAGAQTRTGATATAFRSYTYEGDVAIDLALNGLLHYENSGDAVLGDGFGEGTLNVAFGIMRLADFSLFNASSTAVDIISSINTSFPDCAAGAIAAGGYSSLGDAPGVHTATIGLSNACAGGGITLNPGDSFVVVATLQAISNRGGFIDAMHTFSVQLDPDHTFITGTDELVDPTFLSASINGAVPEPSTWGLMILGLGGLGVAIRSQRRRLAAVL
jgi:hypothetical protein|nr:hypothetical protein [Phenylobacterium sp.]